MKKIATAAHHAAYKTTAALLNRATKERGASSIPKTATAALTKIAALAVALLTNALSQVHIAHTVSQGTQQKNGGSS